MFDSKLQSKWSKQSPLSSLSAFQPAIAIGKKGHFYVSGIVDGELCVYEYDSFGTEITNFKEKLPKLYSRAGFTQIVTDGQLIFVSVQRTVRPTVTAGAIYCLSVCGS